MKIKTFKVVHYKGHPIYMRLIRYSFEYITIIDNEVYTANFIITPTKYNKFMQKCGRMEIPYTEEELQKILGMLAKYAMAVIDTVEEQKTNNVKGVPVNA